MLGAPATIHAQSVAAGTVELPRNTDTVVAPHVRVLLHRVARESQGPLDSTTADARGRFRIRFRPDTGALYLLSARYGGIEYFSSPVHTNPARPDTAIRLLVYDTSSAAPVAVAARHIVVPRPGEDGSRTVLDLVVVRNEGVQARVAPDSTRPSWAMALPSGSVGLEVGESDVSPEAVSREGDSVLVMAPLAPGDKQLTLEYLLPGNRSAVDFPLEAGAMVNVLVEEPAARVTGGTLALADSQQIEGRWFHRWSGRIDGGGAVHLILPRPGPGQRWLLPGLVAGLALALGLATWRVTTRRTPRPVPGRLADPGRLLETLAALDARYLGREGEVPSEEWTRYREEREGLKAQLEAALAAVSAGR